MIGTSETARAEKCRALGSALAELAPVVVAFSGGVDSSFLLAMAERSSPGRVRAVIGVSPSLAADSLAGARAFARSLGTPLEELPTDEMSNPDYVRNGPDRCFHCKDELYGLLSELASRERRATVIDGTNADDLREVRPGRAAARQHGVRSPLAELGWIKAEIREESRRIGLPTWDQPASPCLSSRIPHGTAVRDADLRRIEAGEAALRSLGFPVVRVRHHGDLARVEVPGSDLARLEGVKDAVERALRAVGYGSIVLDPAGYRVGGADRSGSADPRAMEV